MFKRINGKKGSTFFFTIPYIPVQEVKITDISDNAPEEQVGNLKILIAEDDEVSKILISILIKEVAKEVINASTGYEAVEACRNNPDIDLVLMDIKMPGMDGYEATRQIRKFNTGVPIIAQTAYGLNGDRAKAIKAGCTNYISKPVNPVVLKKMINSIFIT